MTSSTGAEWPTCDEPGCQGIRLGDAKICLAHAAKSAPELFNAELNRMREQRSIDARGMQLTDEFLGRLLRALAGTDGRIVLQSARFRKATIEGPPSVAGVSFKIWPGFDKVTFEGEADFDGATFAGWAGFNGAIFKGRAAFAEVTFGGKADFAGAVFEGWAEFKESIFKGKGEFYRTRFEDWANFEKVTFEDQVEFRKAAFKDMARFEEVGFEGSAQFDNAVWEGWASFNGATFSADARFEYAAFKDRVGFPEVTFKEHALFSEGVFEGSTEFRNANFEGPAWFSEARFEDDVEFGHASFQREASFNSAMFNRSVGFREATVKGGAHFIRAIFKGWAGFTNATLYAAKFYHATFEHNASFRETTFQFDTSFGYATFSGEVSFTEAVFKGLVGFREVTFEDEAEFNNSTLEGWAVFPGSAEFHRAVFAGETNFRNVAFKGMTSFSEAVFKDLIDFADATLEGLTDFTRVTFDGEARLDSAAFKGSASFDWANFQGQLSLRGAIFDGSVTFNHAIFQKARQIGPLLVSQRLDVNDVVFHSWVQLEIAAASLHMGRTQFIGGTQMRVRWASVVLDDASLALPSVISGVPAFEDLNEAAFAPEWNHRTTNPVDEPSRPRLLSLVRSDVAGLRIANVDLQACRFVGAHNLDKLRIEGGPLFALPPAGWSWRRLGGEGSVIWRWTPRLTLAEEQQWRRCRKDLRNTPAGRPHPQRSGWYPSQTQTGRKPSEEPMRTPMQIAALYRELRKGREDSKDEPGAADFYYGEMEMRRLGDTTPLGERFILWLYWLTSGYGLRGLRALACLALVVVTIAGLFHIVGFHPIHPNPSRPWSTSLVYAAESTLSLGNDAVQLTEPGRLLRMALRLTGPVLLGLALLSVRNRVKR